MPAARSVIVIPRLTSAPGLALIRIAPCTPYTCTWLTPWMMEICCATTVLAYLYRSASVMLSVASASSKMAWSFGLVLVNVGGEGRSTGNCPVARWIAACTSVAASPRLLLRSNCNVSEQLLCVDALVISDMPSISKNCFSSGVAMLFAIVSGLAPGYVTLTLMTG